MSRITPPPPLGWDSWEIAMHCALKEAEKALAKNEIPVGAIVLSSDGKILGKGHNQSISKNDPTAHAEIIAIKNAAKHYGNYRLDGSFMVVSLEPCLMCTGAIIHSRIAGVVFGAYDKKTGCINSCLDGLDLPFHNSKPWHMGGIALTESQALLQNFFNQKRKL